MTHIALLIAFYNNVYIIIHKNTLKILKISNFLQKLLKYPLIPKFSQKTLKIAKNSKKWQKIAIFCLFLLKIALPAILGSPGGGTPPQPHFLGDPQNGKKGAVLA